MADNLGNLTAGAVVLKMMEIIKKEFPILARANVLHHDKPAQLGDTIDVSYVVGGEAQDFPGTNKDANKASIPVKLGSHRVYRVVITADQIQRLKIGDAVLIDQLANAGVRTLCEDLMAQFRAIMTAANVTPELAADLNDFDYTSMVELRKQLNKNGASKDRYAILGADAFARLLLDPNITDKQKNPDGINTVGTAVIKAVAGMDVYEDSDMPEGDLLGLAMAVESLALATAVPAVPSGEAASMAFTRKVITEPTSKLQMLLEEMDTFDDGYVIRVSWLTGVGANDKEKDHAVRVVGA